MVGRGYNLTPPERSLLLEDPTKDPKPKEQMVPLTNRKTNRILAKET